MPSSPRRWFTELTRHGSPEPGSSAIIRAGCRLPREQSHYWLSNVLNVDVSLQKGGSHCYQAGCLLSTGTLRCRSSAFRCFGSTLHESSSIHGGSGPNPAEARYPNSSDGMGLIVQELDLNDHIIKGRRHRTITATENYFIFRFFHKHSRVLQPCINTSVLVYPGIV